MIEVEIKVSITNPNQIRELLKKKKAIYKCSLIHEDTYYNMPEGLRDFKKTDEAFRVRKSIEFNKYYENDKKIIKYFLTYKGAKLNSKTKTRKELESLIEEGTKIKEILAILGFREVITVKKQRELFKADYKNQSIDVLIDFLPILNQYFIEVESLSESEDNIEANQEVLFDFLDSLGISRNKSIIKSYLELIVEKFATKEN